MLIGACTMPSRMAATMRACGARLPMWNGPTSSVAAAVPVNGAVPLLMAATKVSSSCPTSGRLPTALALLLPTMGSTPMPTPWSNGNAWRLPEPSSCLRRDTDSTPSSTMRISMVSIGRSRPMVPNIPIVPFAFSSTQMRFIPAMAMGAAMVSRYAWCRISKLFSIPCVRFWFLMRHYNRDRLNSIAK